MRAKWLIGLASSLAMLTPLLAAGIEEQLPPQEVPKGPSTILIIRHAEKPPDELASPDLTPRGTERAQALWRLFEASATRPDPFPKPDFIFATRNSKISHRPVDTVAPLAKRLGLSVNASFRNEDSASLAQELLRRPIYSGKTILICWHHGTIPDLAGNLQAAGYPKSWKGALFDRVWQISYATAKPAIADRPQRLLPGDLDK